MSTRILVTEFAPAERVPIEMIHRQHRAITESPLTPELLNSVLNFVFIVNQQRQIVFASRNVGDLLQGKSVDSILGLRPGEALDCAHADDMEAGCGTSVFCRECGAAKAILASLHGQKATLECHLTRIINLEPVALDLLVYALPFDCQGQKYGLFSVVDISHENRRRALERIFFHDVVNSAGGLHMLAELLQQEAPAELQESMSVLKGGLDDLLEEILAQRELSQAESGELAVKPVAVESQAFLAQAGRLFERQGLAQGKRVVAAAPSPSLWFFCDAALLKRVLANLLKNALEASQEGDTVTLGCEAQGGQIRFWVRNPAVMPLPVQLQVFNRSFSTKGTGRGLGTYSVRLLTEKYLKGTVSFESVTGQGTTFSVSLPLVVPPGLRGEGAAKAPLAPGPHNAAG